MIKISTAFALLTILPNYESIVIPIEPTANLESTIVTEPTKTIELISSENTIATTSTQDQGKQTAISTNQKEISPFSATQTKTVHHVTDPVNTITTTIVDSAGITAVSSPNQAIVYVFLKKVPKQDFVIYETATQSGVSSISFSSIFIGLFTYLIF